MEYLEKNKVILIQGAMDIEVNYFISILENKKFTRIAGYDFYEGTINDTKVIISKTLIGTVNATISTTIGIMNFKPNIVINQGIAGAHRENLHIGDIILGEKCCNINSYEMPVKNKGEGSNPFEWNLSKYAKDVKYANSELINFFEKKLSFTTDNKIYKGILGSGDVFSREYDRIVWITNTFDNLSEDMESIGVYSVCDKFNIHCVGIRIISNNELLLEKLNEEKAIELQKILTNILL